MFRHYQAQIKDFIVNNESAFVIVDMGLGKTLAALKAIEELKNSFMISKTLVIAPLRVATHVWPDEIEKWNIDLTYSLVAGKSAKKRKQAVETNADIHIINRENISWLVESFNWPWDMVIIDESSSFKCPTSQRFKAMKQVRGLISRIVLLTGTPAANSLLDLWAQMWLIDGGKRLLSSYYTFRNRYFEAGRYKYYPCRGATHEIHELVSEVSINFRLEDYNDLPEIVHINRYIELPDSIMKQYKKLERDLYIELQGSTLRAANAAVLQNKLQQYIQGAMYDSESEEEYHVIHNEKFEELEEIVEEAQGAHMIIAYTYQSDLERLKLAYPEGTDIREKGAIERWNRKEIQILFAHPASAGHGLNLQDGGHILVWLGLPWSLELWLQMNKRIHRSGQTATCLIYRIVARNTVDERILYALDKKQKVQDALRSAL